MLTPDLLDRLRCPMAPSRSKLEDDGWSLVCVSCRLSFPMREGIPSLLPEEAQLPEGCASLEDLPCRKERP